MASSAACRAKKFFFGPRDIDPESAPGFGGGDFSSSSTMISGEEAGEKSNDCLLTAAAAAVSAECARAKEGKLRLIFFGMSIGRLGRNRAGLRVIGAIGGINSLGVAVTVAIGSKPDDEVERGVILYTGATGGGGGGGGAGVGRLTVIEEEELDILGVMANSVIDDIDNFRG